MAKDPAVILQMRRMGDIIMTFPLMLDQLQQNPDMPLWIVAHPTFYRDLAKLAPSASFYPVSTLPELQNKTFSRVINLSSQPEAALFTLQAEAPLKYGLTGTPDNLHIKGYWQLYHAALTGNNRHNLFHWADLFRMDASFPLKNFIVQHPEKKRTGRAALFLGASDAAKRPDAEFWSLLAIRLVKAGFMPLLLGGSAEKQLGEEVGKRAKLPSFCGKTDILQLASLLRNSDLLISPDTGPMHLADWLGVPVLNLSLGNVSPWDTGPVSSGQWICTASISCAGCWHCWRGRQYCRNSFTPAAIADIAKNILASQEIPIHPGLRILQTSRQSSGLYLLKDIHQKKPSLNLLLGQFWQTVFLHFSGNAPVSEIATAAALLAEQNPGLLKSMADSQQKLTRLFLASRKKGAILEDDFWKRIPNHTSLFAGHCQMTLQNENYALQSWNNILARTALLREIFSAIL